jgi:hypothetical protein
MSIRSRVIAVRSSLYSLFSFVLRSLRIPARLPSERCSFVTEFSSLIDFLLIALSIVGYSDINPVSEVARMLAIAEAMFGTFNVTLLIARSHSAPSKSPLEVADR